MRNRSDESELMIERDVMIVFLLCDLCRVTGHHRAEDMARLKAEQAERRRLAKETHEKALL